MPGLDRYVAQARWEVANSFVMTQFTYRNLPYAMWVAWAAYWSVAAWNVKATERKESLGSRLLYSLPLLAAAWLLLAQRLPVTIFNDRLVTPSPWTFWLGTLCVGGGLLFAAWARAHIGRNWSGTITVKEQHELIMSGPYGLVRHPIYAGLLFALAGTVLVRDELRGVLSVPLAWLSFRLKYRVEERWMTERFGAQYRAYKQRVPALIPVFRKDQDR